MNQDILQQNSQFTVYRNGRVEWHGGSRGTAAELPINVKPDTRSGQKGYIFSQTGTGNSQTMWVPEDTLNDTLSFIGNLMGSSDYQGSRSPGGGRSNV